MSDIDLVIPMVFPGDGEWLKRHARCYGGDAARSVRFRSWGTEELLVRCAIRHMPWLRRIVIVLAGPTQVQPWMAGIAEAQTATDGPRLDVVFHADFIPEEYLPCFSSCLIEMFLGRIPGLGERFVYGNDDMFPLSPLAEDDFFRGGLPCQHLKEKPFPDSPNLFQRKCMYQQNMVGAPFGRRFTSTWLRNGHSLAPILKSSCREVWSRHGREITAHLSPLRRTDRSHNQYVYVLYQHFAGLYADHVPLRRLAGRAVQTDRLEAVLSDPEAGIVCVNDNEDIADWERRAAIVRRVVGDRLKQP